MGQLGNIYRIKDKLASKGDLDFNCNKLSQLNFDRVCEYNKDLNNIDCKIQSSFLQLQQLNQRRL
jgi:uncharacterized protein